MNSYPGGTPSGQERLGSVLASARLAITSSIATRTKEEQQIRARVEFGVERRRIRVERDRTRVREFLVSFDWVNRPQSTVAPCIYRVGRSCPSRTRQIYL
jgi:hypothetical protein